MKKSELRKMIQEEIQKLNEGWKSEIGPFDYNNSKKVEDILHKLNISSKRETTGETHMIYLNLSWNDYKKLKTLPEYNTIKKLMVI